MAQMKADMMNIDKDKTKTKKKDEDDEKVDASKDQATQEVKPDGEKKEEQKVDTSKDQATSEVKADGAEEQKEKVAEEKKKEEPAAPPKIGLLTKAKLSMKEKRSNMSEKFKAKSPKMHEKLTGYADEFSLVWKETFPQTKSVTKDKMDKRKERARIAKEWEEKQKDMT